MIYAVRCQRGLAASAKAIDLATVALGGASGRRRALNLTQCALGCGEFLATLTALIGLSIKVPGGGRGAADLAEDEHLDLEFRALGFDAEDIADADVAGRLSLDRAGMDAAELTGPGGKGSGLKESRCPEPFVDAHSLHRFIFTEPSAR